MKKARVCGDCKWFRRIVGEEIESYRGDCVLNPVWVRKQADTPACSNWKRGK